MSDLKTHFETVVANGKALAQRDDMQSERPDNATLIKIYGLYKQATEGDNTEKKPPFSDFIARAKWDGWSAQKGLSADEAMRQYIDLVEPMQAEALRSKG
jgi:acyl-CoA-binding protein